MMIIRGEPPTSISARSKRRSTPPHPNSFLLISQRKTHPPNPPTFFLNQQQSSAPGIHFPQTQRQRIPGTLPRSPTATSQNPERKRKKPLQAVTTPEATKPAEPMPRARRSLGRDAAVRASRCLRGLNASVGGEVDVCGGSRRGSIARMGYVSGLVGTRMVELLGGYWKKYTVHKMGTGPETRARMVFLRSGDRDEGGGWDEGGTLKVWLRGVGGGSVWFWGR